MKTVLEAPVPFLIGLNYDIKELSPDILKVNLDCNRVIIDDPLPKLPSDLYKVFYNKLKTAVKFSVSGYDPLLQGVDQAFTVMYVDMEDQVEFNWLAIREATVEFMVTVLKDYQKFVVSSET